MDKLKPIIRNHFWILAGLVVPLVLYGYYSANGALKAATEEREKALDAAKNGVSSGHEPNNDYITKLDHINTFLDASVQDAIVDLWRKQQERMTWPQAVAAKIPDEFMGEFDQQVPFIYTGLYPELIRRLQRRAQPVEPLAQDAGTPMPMDLSGRTTAPRPPVKTVNQKLILAAMVPHAQFGQFAITFQEMWDAQIDIWLTEILIDAIVKVNADKESISDAVIRRIDAIELMGGTGVPLTKDSAAPGGDMSGMEGGFGSTQPNMGTAIAPSTIVFSPEEEFGPAIESAGADGGGLMSEGPGGGGTAVVPPKRYVGETEEAPYLERGFYLSVIIQQSKIADFIVTLANSDWPVQVRRFQVGVNPYQVESLNITSSPGTSGMMGGSFEGRMSPPTLGVRGASNRSRGGGLGGSGGRREQFGMGTGNTRAGLENPYGENIPDFAMAALNNSDLVQMELCGVITMYKQPKEALAAVEARKQQEAAARGMANPEAIQETAPTASDSIEVPATPVGEMPADGTPLPDGTVPPTPSEADLTPVVPNLTPPTPKPVPDAAIPVPAGE